METTLYALFLISVAVLIIVRKREIKRRGEGHYLKAYFELMDLPIEQRSVRLKQWESKAYKQAFPELYKSDAEQSQSENVVSIHKAI